MEEKRVEFLHHSMCIYINILSTTSGQEQESYEQFWKALDVCDPKTDVEKFIDEKGTGNMIPGKQRICHCVNGYDIDCVCVDRASCICQLL